MRALPAQPVVFLVGDSHAAAMAHFVDGMAAGTVGFRWVAAHGGCMFGLSHKPVIDGLDCARFNDFVNGSLATQLQAGDALAIANGPPPRPPNTEGPQRANQARLAAPHNLRVGH